MPSNKEMAAHHEAWAKREDRNADAERGVSGDDVRNAERLAALHRRQAERFRGKGGKS